MFGCAAAQYSGRQVKNATANSACSIANPTSQLLR
jgi:hypothetical protein